MICEILGSGTSTGVPMPGCNCSVCHSDNPRDQRLRSSIMLTGEEGSVIVDTTPDFRQQVLRCGLQKLKAVLLTHNHADHVSGLDDVRPFCLKINHPIPVYGPPRALEWVRKRFDYIWDARDKGTWLPTIELVPVEDKFKAAGIEIVPIPLWHGNELIYGYRCGKLAYLSDTSGIPDDSLVLLQGVEILIIDGLRPRPHPTHLSFSQAVATGRKIGAAQVWLTHIAHEEFHSHIDSMLPVGFRAAYDGLRISF